jgi:sugar (pentulose or hexulose) kinase
MEHVPLDYPGSEDHKARPIFFPYISGERGLLWNNRATGMFVGLRESHDTKDIVRAVYEGVAFSLREILEGVKSLGVKVDVVISGSTSDLTAWSKLRADMYGMSIYFPKQGNVTGLGAALLGLVGIQVHDSLETAVYQCTSTQNIVSPDIDMQIHYDRQWTRYKALLPLVSQLF